MKVMYLLESTRFSGAENVVCQIIEMMKSEKIDVLYCSRDGQIHEALKERNIKFLPIKKMSVKEVKRIIKEYEPDIIHAHDMKATFIASIACGNIRLISHVHNNNFNSRGISLKSIAFLLACIKVKHIFWVSSSAFNGYAFHNILKKKSEVLYNIIDIKSLYNKMEEDCNKYKFDIVYLGRLTTPKNPERLLKVVRKIVNEKPEVRTAIIGTGDLEKKVRNIIKELELEKNVTILGFKNNPYKILYDSKLMLMTSLWEGTPMCTLEAMSLGVPIVSTPTDGIKFVVQQGITGYLSEDDNKLKEYCCSILNDNNLQEYMSKMSIIQANKIMNIEKYKEKIMSSYFNK